MRTKVSNRIMTKSNQVHMERESGGDTDARWVFLGFKVMDELRVLARLARPAVKR